MKRAAPLAAVLTVLTIIFAFSATAQQAAPASPLQQPSTPSLWREQYAYSLGLQAYIYNFPLFYLSQLRYERVMSTDPEQAGSFNAFTHVRRLTTAEDGAGGSPNNDTLYSVAWVDLRQGPVILSVPPMDRDRYYTFEIADMYSDNFAYVGRRTTGIKGGDYALVPPQWQGELPEGVEALPTSPTPFAYILGRTLVYSPEDVPNVTKLQDQYRLTPLQYWGKEGVQIPVNRDVWRPWGMAEELGAWRTINRALAENPPPERDAGFFKVFEQIGIGPGLDLDKLDPDTRRGLARAQADGLLFLQQIVQEGGYSRKVNGWFYPPPTMGRAGHHRDFITRAGQQCLAGVVANDPEEAVYLPAYFDGDGQRLDGRNHYAIRFGPGQEPKVEGFWSLTLYDLDFRLVPNPLRRHSIGDRTQGLQRDPDGGLTLYIQHDRPGRDRESNWLPAPAGPFYVVLRTYQPGPEIVKQTWLPPPLMRIQ